MGAAGMDQIWCAMGAVENQKMTGICTIPKLAEDVFTENLDFFLEDREFDSKTDVVFLNSKGFGGNNATSAFISSDLTHELLEKRHGKSDVSKWEKKKENAEENRLINKQMAINNEIEPIYDFDKDVLEIQDLKITKNNIKTSTVFDYKIESDLDKNDFN